MSGTCKHKKRSPVPLLLALDDTDSPSGGCTTHVGALVADAIGWEHVVGSPRLVRLFPANPWKTRGNAAVVLEVSDAFAPAQVLALALDVVKPHAHVSPGKGAGIVVFEEPPDEAWYGRGVRGLVPLDEARDAVREHPHATLGEGRGIIGALCAAAWRPSIAGLGGSQPPVGPVSRASATWERIAYRERERWGTPRDVDAASLFAVQDSYPETFDCVDPRAGRPVMVPHTPCPVLYGLRATTPDRLERACGEVRSEPVERAVTFIANHASDDHLAPETLRPLAVIDKPRTLAGGHAYVDTRAEDGERVRCMAFEPTGSLRHALLAVREGDRLVACGTVRRGERGERGVVVNLEKFLHAPAARRKHTACPGCGRALRSAGRAAPMRCRKCGYRAVPAFEAGEPRWHEADAKARRHLARPLRLGLARHVTKAVGS